MTTGHGGSIRAWNARQGLIMAAESVMTNGSLVAPRGMKTRELEHFTLIVEDPSDWHCAGINANWSAKVAAVEALQLIGGFSDPGLVKKFAPSLMNFANKAGGFDGAYGPRAQAPVVAAVKRLKEDRDTRQAIIPIWDAEDALREHSKDYPCTLSLGLAIRADKLNMSVTMRSNDVDWGMKHDLSQFMLLQCSVANVLGVGVGRYRHTAYSLHLYERSWEWAAGLNISHNGKARQVPRGGIVGATAKRMQARAQFIAAGEPIAAPNSVERWLDHTLYG